MLIISRRMNEIITIEPFDRLDNTTLATVFARRAIEIKLIQIGDTRVRIAVDVPPDFRIWRGISPPTGDPHSSVVPAAAIPIRTESK
jgi:sRNA-binding carbon storage regulator CsrA